MTHPPGCICTSPSRHGAKWTTTICPIHGVSVTHQPFTVDPERAGRLAPQSWNEAILMYPFVRRIPSHEWDNRTTGENVLWLLDYFYKQTITDQPEPAGLSLRERAAQIACPECAAGPGLPCRYTMAEQDRMHRDSFINKPFHHIRYETVRSSFEQPAPASEDGMGSQEDALRALCGDAANFLYTQRMDAEGLSLWQRLEDARLGHDVVPVGTTAPRRAHTDGSVT